MTSTTPARPSEPTGRVVLFGATGYTGDLAARSLVRAGARPVLAGRDADRLRRLAAELGGPAGALETAVADVTDPAAVAALVTRGDVLVTTVGPFARWGRPALDAAVDAGAHYVDSTGEGGFIRAVFDEYGERAAEAGSTVLTAFGYDYVPGNLAAALALERAALVSGGTGREPVSVDVGYFLTGSAGAGAVSGGTRASALGVLAEQGHALVDGRIVEERPGSHLVRVAAGGHTRSGFTVSATEQFTLPRLAPTVRTVRVGLGWFGPATPAVTLFAQAANAADAVPGLNALAGRLGAPLAGLFGQGSSGGPDAAARARTGSLVAADVRSGSGELLAHVELEGPNPYSLTGDLLAWAAQTLAAGGALAAGALGPVEAFGLGTLRDACAAAGLAELDGGSA